jgi:hypothetical protein
VLLELNCSNNYMPGRSALIGYSDPPTHLTFDPQLKSSVAGGTGGGSGGGTIPSAANAVDEKQDQAQTPAPETSTEPVTAFGDVSTPDWYYTDVKFVVESGLFKGVSANEFAPQAQMTRAMLATVLHRLAGEPAAAGGASFGDVHADQWFAGAVAWASANEVITGYSADVFGAGNNITREEIAVMLYRYAKLMGFNVSGAADLSAYADAGAISEWALEAIAWANAAGLLTGRTETTLAPADNATRAEVAAILNRFVKAAE